MKVVKIILGIVGALGIGLVGLILACHFRPGLSDTIAGFLYKDKAGTKVESSADPTLPPLDDSEDESKLDTSLAPEGLETPVVDGLDEVLPEGGNLVPVTFASLADYGLTQEDVLNNVEDYFDDCYDQLAAAKGKSTEFYNVVRDSMVADAILKAYDDESYREGFMNKFMDDYKVDTCGWNLDEEELQGGYILIKHSMTRAEDAE